MVSIPIAILLAACVLGYTILVFDFNDLCKFIDKAITSIFVVFAVFTIWMELGLFWRILMSAFLFYAICLHYVHDLLARKAKSKIRAEQYKASDIADEQKIKRHSLQN